MRAAWLVLTLLSVVLAGCGAPRRLDPRSARFAPLTFAAPQPEVSTLPRGAPLYLLADHELPLVRLYLTFRGGSLYDPAEKAGLAAVAGYAWRTGGTQGYSPEEFDEALEDRAVNLSLSFGRKSGAITLSALRQDLPYALDLLEEFLLRPVFAPERVAWAVQQVAAGLRRERDDPVALAYREFRRTPYAGHPRGVVASEESVARVERTDVQQLHRRLLTGGDWVLGVVGDFDAAALRAELERRFGQLPSTGEGFAPIAPPPPGRPRLVLVRKDLPQATLVWGRLGPARIAADHYAVELADAVLGGGGFQSRLTREIRSSRGLAYSVGSFYQALSDFGVLGAQARTGTGAVAEVLALLRSNVQQLAAAGVTAEELRRARDAAINRHVFRYQDVASVVRERMHLRMTGLPEDIHLRYVEELGAVTREQVATAAVTWYGVAAGVTVVVGNLEPEQLTWPGAPVVEVIDGR